jgi:prepilin-type N-terminal cleavage/methylation domain-containing protein
MIMVRRGMSLIELTVASAVVTAMLAIAVQMLVAVAAQRRASDQRQFATLELANVMERLAARPWAELTAEAAAGEQPSAAVRTLLTGVELKVDVSTPAAEPDAKRLSASLRWQDRSGGYLPPVTITTWKYRRM